MKKRTYRAQPFKQIDLKKFTERTRGKDIAVGVDVAKEKLFAALMDEERNCLAIVTFVQPLELRDFVSWLGALEAKSVAVVLEASGTYGDSLRHALRESGLDVFQVGAKRVHDSAEVYDGTPSMHDAKAAAVIAWMHVTGLSKPWQWSSDAKRSQRATLATMELYADAYGRNIGRLEGIVARHWPELTKLFTLGSASLNALLQYFPGPEAVAKAPEEATCTMRKAGLNHKTGKLDEMVASALSSVGVPMLDEERKYLSALCAELEHLRKAKKEAQQHIEAQMEEEKAAKHLTKATGKVTTAVLLAYVDDPANYDSAASYVKALGLNLRERSSGTKVGQLAITKRGHGKPRQYLYLAVWRLIRLDPYFKAWYLRKVERGGMHARQKALVALMRKLATGLWHCAKHDVEFNSRKLFDLRRLQFEVSRDDVNTTVEAA